ncbi:sla2 Src-like adaptor 2 [Entomophthora muscae]|uniref:Sla2 Src-like adaptor 2 n=1 Tax=Entomophthora muscae TaxID=34485 RepID=A0ACC2UKV6_9FUNG|nr:sla2 Src-like adaptor 2 [Entomophthora muscae]
MNFIQSLARAAQTSDNFGYGGLIRGYIDYILKKLNFHRSHSQFNASFDYEDYVSLRGVADPNAGYEIIGELIALSETQDQFHRQVFRSLGGSPTNECKISCLVPLVEESHALYIFIKSMLTALYRSGDFYEALAPLREKYHTLHRSLRQFYYECSQIRYLTSLIAIPQLSADPPSLGAGDDSNRPMTPRFNPTPPPPAPIPDPTPDLFLEQKREYERLQQEAQQRAMQNQQQLELERINQQRAYEEQMRMQQAREQEELERMRQGQHQRQVQGRLLELEQEVFGLRAQRERESLALNQQTERVAQLERELQLRSHQLNQQDQHSQQMAKSQEEQVNLWKSKYEAIAKMYAQLRQEHLDLLAKYKQATAKLNQASEAVRAMERMRQESQQRVHETTALSSERDRMRAELDRNQNAHCEEVARLRQEIEVGRSQLQELGQARGAEMSALVERLEQEKRRMDQELSAKASQVLQLQASRDKDAEDLAALQAAKDEEIAVLQAAMDQTLMALQNTSTSTSQSQDALNRKLASLTTENAAKLNKILDSIYRSCIAKVDQSLFELESSAHGGNPSATPEHALSLIEVVNAASGDFASTLLRFLADQADHSDVISHATEFSQLVSQLMLETKGITRLAEDDVSDQLIASGAVAGKAARKFFDKMLSANLTAIPALSRPDSVVHCNQSFQHDLTEITRIAETLVVKDASTMEVKNAGEDLGNLVEREMLNAANIIEKAAQRLSKLMDAPSDPHVTSTDRQVHSAILDSAMAITNAIAHLIKCATASQQEVVAQGRGSSTKTAFYKKNNRWTEGLISAAKAVALATNMLVEAADGVIHGTHSLEQLMVASNEVAAATAQLVAASRVKANLYSKAQEKLEAASKAVTSAARNLVKAVKEIDAKQREAKQSQLDLKSMAPHEFKVKEMEQQVSILKLEKELASARSELALMRKHSYHYSNEES